MSPIKIVYFVPERAVTSDSILHAQVFGQARVLRSAGFDCMFVGSDHGKNLDSAYSLVDKIFNDALVLPIYPESPSFISLMISCSLAAYQAKARIRKWHPSVIYTRDLLSAGFGRRLARLSGAVDVHDVRGISAESALKRGRTGLSSRLLEWFEKWQVHRASRLLCVSNAMRAWIAPNRYRSDATVVPCCVDTVRFRPYIEMRAQLRQKLGWSEKDKVIVYSGGDSRWQRPEDTIRFLFEVLIRTKGGRLLILSKAQEKYCKLVAESGFCPTDVHICSLQHHEVPAWLNVADVAILLRHDVLVNNVASPVKVGEYLACGLPVILSKGVGDFSDMISREKVGVIVKELGVEDVEVSSELLLRSVSDAACKVRARQVALKELSWEVYIDRYRSVYGKM